MNSTATPPAPPAHRGSLFLEDATVIRQQAHASEQYVLRLHAPKNAAAATPGSFVHLQCDPSLPMRRPLSIMRADPAAGWIDILYKVVGQGLDLLAQRRAGDTISTLGPIGRGFEPHPARPRTLLIGGGVGIPPMIFLAENLLAASIGSGGTTPVQSSDPLMARPRNTSSKGSPGNSGPAVAWKPLVLMGSEIPFPFQSRPSTLLLDGIPAGAIACMPLLEDWGVPSRLASGADFPGCFPGYVTDLAAHWLAALDATTLSEVEIFACGPTPMLKAVAALAKRFALPCQVSLEEFMACAVGGCAGCTVKVQTPDGPAMKRVCVDGPVFRAEDIWP